jgi:exosome complex RNA-binding protein Csl4
MELTLPVKAFIEAQKLKSGGENTYVFLSEKEANSFRVALYKLRNRINDYSITVSINKKEKEVTLSKEGNTVICRHKETADSEAVEIPIVRTKSEYEIKVEEAIRDAESADFTKEQKEVIIYDTIAALNKKMNPRRSTI